MEATIAETVGGGPPVERALIVVAKEPVPGKTKTRLSPPLTQDEAVSLYQSFLLDTLDLVARVGRVQPIIAYTPATAEPYFRSIAPDGYAFMPQIGQSLGERLDDVLTSCLNRGAGLAVVMNSDAPTLPVDYLRGAFHVLEDPGVDVVLGPSEDGGYYLIGLKQPCSPLFDVVMSTPTVLQETVVRAREQALRVACLDPWYDVDTADDLRRLWGRVSSLAPGVAVRTRQTLSQVNNLAARLDAKWPEE
jgi:rSAM/selenodomain-associated transferase 1